MAAHRHAAGKLTDAEFATHYFLHWQLTLHGRRFASRRDRSDARPDAALWTRALLVPEGAPPLIGWLSRYQFTAVHPGAVRALAYWLRGLWRPTLTRAIPAPHDVLHMQTCGTRPVTVLTDSHRMLQPVLGRANAFQFLLHDLEHVDRFFRLPRLYTMQRGLFHALSNAIRRGLFDAPLRDAEFARRFDYLISDMNTHPLHSLYYLRAQLIEHHLRAEYGAIGGPLSVRGRAAVMHVLTTLGVCAGFGVPARDALTALSSGACSPEQAHAIETQLIDIARVQRLHARGARLRML